MQKILLAFVLFFLSANLMAQYAPINFPLDDINGVSLRNAWAGGMNLPQFSSVDLNNDNILDLVVFDRDSKTATPYINHGTPNQVDYHFAPEYIERLPQGKSNYMLFRDYNCDGIEDIFAHNQPPASGAGVGVWKGSYDADNKIQFTLVKDVLKYDYGQAFLGTIFVFNTDVPAIDDIDGDGDLDLLCFTLTFTFPKNIYYYKNMSVENGHGCDSLEYILEHECFGLLEESGYKSICKLSPGIDSCHGNPYWLPYVNRPTNTASIDDQSRGARHIGATLTTIDFNGDGAKDLCLGGVSYRNLNMLTATKINDTLLMVAQDTLFPVYDVPVDIFSFVSSYFLDVNNDGKTDMIAAPTEQGICEAVKDSVAWYYQNMTSDTNMQFAFQQKDFLVGEMLDMGQKSYPVVYDFNADGLLDILIAGEGKCQDPGASALGLAGNIKKSFTLLQNNGTATNPSFRIVATNYANLDSLSKNELHPTLGDLDGDGDMDMLLGSADGTLTYLENKAGVGNPCIWNPPVYNFAGIDVGDNAAPSLADLDQDGDLDLIIGNYAGYVRYYENSGTAMIPSIAPTALTDTLGGYSVSAYYGRNSSPYCYNNNGVWEMFIGEQSGKIAHLDNINNNVLGVYDTLSQNFGGLFSGTYSDIAVADLNGDGFLDYIVGNIRGGLTIYTDTMALITNQKEIANQTQQVITVFPNPTRQKLTISLANNTSEKTQFIIYNNLGQIVKTTTKKAGLKDYHLDVSNLTSGVFFIAIKSDKFNATSTFIKQ